MKNGMFTPEERERLSRLGAVLEVRARQIVYSPEFKKECMTLLCRNAGVICVRGHPTPRTTAPYGTADASVAPSSASSISDIGSCRTPAPLWLLL